MLKCLSNKLIFHYSEYVYTLFIVQTIRNSKAMRVVMKIKLESKRVVG